MKNISEILASLGIDVPEDKAEELNKTVNANYKTVAEFDKRVQRLETERDGFKEQLEVANSNLKGFENMDVEGIKTQLAEAQKKAQEAETNYNARLAERDFDDALKNEMTSYKFTSKAAEDAIMGKIKNAGLKCVDGKIMGLNDLMDSIRESDSGAFVAENKSDEAPPARFTAPLGNPSGKTYSSKEEIMAIKNASERQAAIEQNIDLFT